MKIKLLFILTLVSLQLFCQENKVSNLNCSIGSDLVSSYLWRSFPQGKMPAIQPWGELSYKGLSIGTWASYELGGEFKEIDLYAKFTHKSFSLIFTDLFFPDYPGLNQDYYNFKNATTGHAAELGVSFNGTESIPLSVYSGVILYGTALDPKVSNANELNRSVYFELNYYGNINKLSYNLFAGLTPSASVLYSTNGFSIFNLGVSVKKELQLTETFSLPVKLTLATNTVTRKMHVAASISL
jgi:hypothetical protein